MKCAHVSNAEPSNVRLVYESEPTPRTALISALKKSSSFFLLFLFSSEQGFVLSHDCVSLLSRCTSYLPIRLISLVLREPMTLIFVEQGLNLECLGLAADVLLSINGYRAESKGGI